jgi:hypothetical protein
MLLLILKSFASELRLVKGSLMTVSKGKFRLPLLLNCSSKQEQVMRKQLTISSSSPIALPPGIVLGLKEMTVCPENNSRANQPLKVSLQTRLMNSVNIEMPSKSNIVFRRRSGTKCR